MGAIISEPVIIDIGKTSRGDIKDLIASRGKLLDDVKEAIGQVTKTLGTNAEGKHIIPVVLLYKQKQKDRNRSSLLPLRLPLIG